MSTLIIKDDEGKIVFESKIKDSYRVKQSRNIHKCTNRGELTISELVPDPCTHILLEAEGYSEEAVKKLIDARNKYDEVELIN